MSGEALGIAGLIGLVLLGVANGSKTPASTPAAGSAGSLSSLYVSAAGTPPTTALTGGDIVATGSITGNSILSAGAALGADGSIVGTSLTLQAVGAKTGAIVMDDIGNISAVTLTTSGEVKAASAAIAGPEVITSAASGAFVVGPNGSTNPTFNIDTSAAAAGVSTGVTGLNLASAAKGSGVILSVLSSGTNENLLISSKGASAIQFQISNSASSANPALTINQIANGATGIVITPAIAASGCALSVTSSGANEGVSISSKGTSAVTFQVANSANPALTINQTSLGVTGLSITPAAAASGVAVAVTSSGANENVTIDAKGTGSVAINSVGTGGVTVQGFRNLIAQYQPNSATLVAGATIGVNQMGMTTVIPVVTAAATITIPNPSLVPGGKLEFYNDTLQTTAATKITTTGATACIKLLTRYTATGPTITIGTAATATVNFSSSAAAGSWISLTSDGTYWRAILTSSAAGDITLV